MNKFKKISTLLTVSVFAIFTLSADPQISGSSYLTYSNAVSEASGDFSADDSISATTTVVLSDSTDNTDFCLDVDFAIDEDGDVTLSADEASITFTEADALTLQVGWSQVSMGYSNWFDAGDVLGDTATFNVNAALTLLSDDNSSFVLTPFVKLPTTSEEAGYGVVANYDLTADSGIQGIEAVGYISDGDAQIAATISGSLGIDFAIDGNVLLSDTSDYEVALVLAKSMDSASTYLDVYYDNKDSDGDSVLSIVPQVYYTVDDTTSIIAYYEADYNTTDATLSNWASLGVKKYLSDDFYVYPYVDTTFDSSQVAEFNLKFYKSF